MDINMCLVAHEERRKHGTAVRIEVGTAVGNLLPAEPGRRAEKIGISAGFSCHAPEIRRAVGGFLRFPYNVFLLVLLLRLYMVLWWSW